MQVIEGVGVVLEGGHELPGCEDACVCRACKENWACSRFQGVIETCTSVVD